MLAFVIYALYKERSDRRRVATNRGLRLSWLRRVPVSAASRGVWEPSIAPPVYIWEKEGELEERRGNLEERKNIEEKEEEGVGRGSMEREE